MIDVKSADDVKHDGVCVYKYIITITIIIVLIIILLLIIIKKINNNNNNNIIIYVWLFTCGLLKTQTRSPVY